MCYEISVGPFRRPGGSTSETEGGSVYIVESAGIGRFRLRHHVKEDVDDRTPLAQQHCGLQDGRVVHGSACSQCITPIALANHCTILHDLDETKLSRRSV